MVTVVMIQATRNQSYGEYPASRRKGYLRLAAVTGSCKKSGCHCPADSVTDSD